MTGLVLELQRDALNPETKASTLLQKSLAISKKLNIIEIQEWVNNELDGYSSIENLPKYRILYGKLEAKNPYHGWLPVLIESAEISNTVSKKEITIPVGEIESLSEEESLNLRVDFPSELNIFLMQEFRIEFPLSLLIGKRHFSNILDSIKTKILNWALELEQQGILGEGMSFSTEEKTKAQQVNYHITNNIGSMHNSQLQQDSAHATQSLNITETNQADLKKFVEELKAIADSLALAQEQKQELNEHIAILESQSKSAKPNSVIIKESGRTIRNLIEGAMGSTISSGLVAYFHLFQ